MKNPALTMLLAAAPMGALAASSPDEEDMALYTMSQPTISLATGSQQLLRRAPAVATVISAGDIAAMDATLTHHAAGGWAISASVRNLFDADAREPTPSPGLALPGDIPVWARALMVQLCGKW